MAFSRNAPFFSHSLSLVTRKFVSAVPLTSFKRPLFFSFTEKQGCELVAKNNSVNVRRCLIFYYIRVTNRRVLLGAVNQGIQLEETRRSVLFCCDWPSTIYSWKYAKKDGNLIRVSFLKGYLDTQVYMCHSLNGPSKPGIHCAIEAFSSVCLGHS